MPPADSSACAASHWPRPATPPSTLTSTSSPSFAPQISRNRFIRHHDFFRPDSRIPCPLLPRPPSHPAASPIRSEGFFNALVLIRPRAAAHPHRHNRPHRRLPLLHHPLAARAQIAPCLISRYGVSAIDRIAVAMRNATGAKVWQGAIVRVPQWVVEEGQPPVRPIVAVWVSSSSGRINTSALRAL